MTDPILDHATLTARYFYPWPKKIWSGIPDAADEGRGNAALEISPADDVSGPLLFEGNDSG